MTDRVAGERHPEIVAAVLGLNAECPRKPGPVGSGFDPHDGCLVHHLTARGLACTDAIAFRRIPAYSRGALTPAQLRYERTKAGLARKDAARARGWAKRIRSGWVPPASDAELGSAFADQDIPF